MGRASVKIEGLDKFRRHLLDLSKMEAVRKVVAMNGSELQQKAMANCNFRGHFEGKKFVSPTGTLKRSIQLRFEDDNMVAVIEPKAYYGAYVELGTRFMTAQPYLGPAWRIQQQIFQNDLKKLGLE